mmetsp:Transcript_78190/g.126800  ORF Transcript_78190/g.126800 Transcript_78190/m.126800 type:complete len:318 (+) Transcript_78190:2-955(+)
MLRWSGMKQGARSVVAALGAAQAATRAAHPRNRLAASTSVVLASHVRNASNVQNGQRRQQPPVRMMSGPRAGNSESKSSDLDRIQGVVKDMLKNSDPQSAASSTDLKNGWQHVDVGDLMQGQAQVNGMVVLEKKLSTGEFVNLVSSYEVVNRDEDTEDEEDAIHDENQENGFKHSETSILFLVAVDKPGAQLPLFFECVGDRYGYEILRVHVGLGMAGFMSDHSGHPSLLYHVYMSYKDSREGKDNDVPGDGMEDMPSSACSPEFDTLDARLQDKFMDFLSEKGVDAIIVEGLFDSVMAKGQQKYVSFLSSLDSWLK